MDNQYLDAVIQSHTVRRQSITLIQSAITTVRTNNQYLTGDTVTVHNGQSISDAAITACHTVRTDNQYLTRRNHYWPVHA
jgi:riboflavin biosynthesis pyrimidine reductase